MRRLASLVVCLASLAVAGPALAQPAPAGAGTYRPPVDAPVTDPFRAPPSPYGPGNRGIDYDTQLGAPVHAAHDGEVVFAGPVAGSLHVVVLHPDGVRTSYSFLESAAVRRGDRVQQGQLVGTAGESLHFGARVGDVYIDPATLFGSGLPEVYLVPDEELRPHSEERERGGIVRMLTRLPGQVARSGSSAAGWAREGAEDVAGAAVDAAEWAGGTAGDAAGWARDSGADAAGAAADAAGWARDGGAEAAGAAIDGAQWAGDTAVDAAGWAAAATLDGAEWAAGQGARLAAALAVARFEELRGLLHYAQELSAVTHAYRLAQVGRHWWRQRHRCVPDDVPVPPPPEKRRMAVLVGGLGSTSEHAAIDDLGTDALGYAPDDVMRFSYLGGTTAEQPYGAVDTTADLRQSGRRLRALLERLAVEHPGVPVDIVAHSQGGLVARSALAYETDVDDARLPPIGSLITLGTPHHGTDGATALRMFGHSEWGSLAEEVAGHVIPGGFDPKSTSLAQMAETSEFMRRLNRRPLPAGLRARSIGAREDLVVPAGRTHLAGADNVVVSVPGHLRDHDGLPGSPAAQREVALGLAGLPPTCQSLPDMVADAAVSDAIGMGEDAVGAVLWAGGRVFDSRLPFLPSILPGGGP